jgi:hypothetical protein
MGGLGLVFVAAAWVLVGCNEVDEPPPDVLIRAFEYKGPNDPTPPFAGVQVCQTDTDNCTWTEEDGEARLALWPEERIALSAAKEGYLSLLQPYVPDAPACGRQCTVTFVMFSDEDVARDFESLQSPYPQRDTGSVTIFVNPPPFPGATFTLVTATGKAFYEEGNGTLHLELEATPPSGMGGFVDVSPGDHQIELGGSAQDCAPALAWPGDRSNRITVPIRAGHWTTAGVVCRK